MKDLLLWILWFPVRYLVWILPLKLSLILGSHIGNLFGLLIGGRKKFVSNELSLLGMEKMGKAELERVVSRSYRLWGMNQIEVLLFPKMDPQMMNKLVPQVEITELDKALQKNNGVILMIAHFGSNRMVLPALGYLDYNVFQIGAPANIWKEITPDEISTIKGILLDLERKFEQQLPAKFIFGNMVMRQAIKALKANSVLVVAADGRGGDRWAEVDFFKRKALFSLMPIVLAQKTGAALLPTFVIRQANKYHRLTIAQPLECNREIGPEKVIKEYVKILESYISSYPCHYAEFLRFIGMRSRKGDTPMFVD